MQLQPRAVVDALLPDSWRGDNLTLRPLTAGDVLFLEKLGCNIFADNKECSPEDAYLAAFVLCESPGVVEQRWLIGRNVLLESVIWSQTKKLPATDQIRSALYGLLAQAFDSCVKTEWPKQEGMAVTVTNSNPHGNGLGWILTAVDALCVSYHWTYEYVIGLPLSRVFALLTARRIANGAEFAEPDFYEREELDDVAKQLGVNLNG